MNIQLNELADFLVKNVFEDAPHYRLQYDKLIAERDTSDVWRQFAIWLLVDPDHGVIRFTKPDSERYQAIKHVAYLYSTHCKDRELWEYASAAFDADADADAASWAAASAAYYAARAEWSAAYYAHAAAAAAHAAAAAAYYAAAAVKAAAGAAAARAAYAAARAAAWSAEADAWAAAFAEAHRHMADKLLELLQSAPPKEAI